MEGHSHNASAPNRKNSENGLVPFQQEQSGTSPTLSVVIPAHRAKSVIQPTLQTLGRLKTRLEILVIENGSNELSQEDIALPGMRCTLVNLKTADLSSARNIGAEISSGKFVWFLDADDLFFPSDVDFYIARAESLDADGVVLGEKKVNRNSLVAPVTGDFHFEEDLLRRRKSGNCTFSGQSTFSFLLGRGLYSPVTGGYIWNREFLLAHRLRFEEFKYHEDLAFTLGALQAAKKVLRVCTPSFIKVERVDGLSKVLDSMVSAEGYRAAIATIEKMSAFLRTPRTRIAFNHYLSRLRLIAANHQRRGVSRVTRLRQLGREEALLAVKFGFTLLALKIGYLIQCLAEGRGCCPREEA
jgi:hypothetical protein